MQATVVKLPTPP